MNKKRKDGKGLEKVVRLIHETLKDRPNTVVHSNYKIKNTNGRKREFDVFIEASVNDISIKIAIECKAYKKPIGVDKIESFKGKCDRLPEINRRIFVSESGYQADAINAARDFGIDLFDLKSINQDIILKWFPINQLGLRFIVKEYKLGVETTPEVLNQLNTEKYTDLYIGKNKEKQKVVKMINDLVIQNKKELWAINIYEFMRNGGGESVGKVTTLPLSIELVDAYILSTTGEQYSVRGIEAIVDSWFIETQPKIKDAQSFSTQNETRANRLSIDMGTDQEQTDIIITKDKFKLFQTDKEGKTTELKVIAKYDPKTDKYSGGE